MKEMRIKFLNVKTIREERMVLMKKILDKMSFTEVIERCNSTSAGIESGYDIRTVIETFMKVYEAWRIDFCTQR